MNQQKIVVVLIQLFVIWQVARADSGGTNFQPSVGVVIGILSIMFSLTFLLLVYARFCHPHGGASVLWINHHHTVASLLPRSASGSSGIDKRVIESLPFFNFSSLGGSRGGVDCAVCLSKFEDVEVLRLLPKCNHAFHVACVDLWLHNHSTCPICRCTVSADDVTAFSGSESLRLSDSGVELFVEREDGRVGSWRLSIGIDHREVLIRSRAAKDRNRAVLSGVMFNNRWSSISSSDLTFLNSEMLSDTWSKRFSELNDRKALLSNPGRPITAAEKRSVSDITSVGRVKNKMANEKEERIRRLWLPIARNTLERFANTENTSTQSQTTLNV